MCTRSAFVVMANNKCSQLTLPLPTHFFTKKGKNVKYIMVTSTVKLKKTEKNKSIYWIKLKQTTK